MTDNPLNTAPESDLLHPELWLLIVDPDEEPDAQQLLNDKLRELSTADALAAWRLHHGRVRLVAGAQLQAELQAALAVGCPAVHLHASLSEDALFDSVLACRLPSPSERLLNLHGWSSLLADWWPEVAGELTRPDAWVEVGWRLSRGARIPPLALPGDAASGVSYKSAFMAWQAERTQHGDMGLFDGDDDEQDESFEAESSAAAQGYADSTAQDDIYNPWSTGGSPSVWARPPAGNDLHVRGRGGAGWVQAAPQGLFAAPKARWFPIAQLEGETAAPDGSGTWPYRMVIERQSRQQEGQWTAVQASLTWTTPEGRAGAPRHAFRLFLLPRLKPAEVADFPPGVFQAVISASPSLIAQRMLNWADELPGTPVMLVALP